MSKRVSSSEGLRRFRASRDGAAPARKAPILYEPATATGVSLRRAVRLQAAPQLDHGATGPCLARSYDLDLGGEPHLATVKWAAKDGRETTNRPRLGILHS